MTQLETTALERGTFLAGADAPDCREADDFMERLCRDIAALEAELERYRDAVETVRVKFNAWSNEPSWHGIAFEEFCTALGAIVALANKTKAPG